MKEVNVDDEKLEAVPEFCYLGDMHSAGGGRRPCGCELAENVFGASSANCSPFSQTAMCPLLPEAGCILHVYGV